MYVHQQKWVFRLVSIIVSLPHHVVTPPVQPPIPARQHRDTIIDIDVANGPSDELVKAGEIFLKQAPTLM